MNARPAYPPPTLDDVAWQAAAACHPQADTAIHPEHFFPAHKAEVYARDAKRVCRHCPVRNECLTFALTHNHSGIWGGTTDRERADRRRRWAA